MTRDDLKPPPKDQDSLALADALDAQGRHADAINVLAKAARLGDAAAKGRVGARLLFGDRAPALPAQGADLVAEAAREGAPDAAALLATLSAAGAYRAQSWSQALDWLQRAAELGHAPARGQLAVLSSDRALAAESEAGGAMGSDLWRRLREGIDLAGLRAAPPGRTLCAEPLIRAFEGFASPQICDWLMARAADRLQRAETYGGRSANNEVSGARTNSIRVFSLLETDLVQLLLQARMSSATGISFSHMEAPTVLHYAAGQEFAEHYDFVDPGTPGYQTLLARDGERLKTFLVYLNDDYEGGETDFPRLGVRHKGARGEGMFFTNALADGGPDLRALHAGRPPTRGQKWVVSQFIRSRPFVPGAAQT